MDILNIFLKWRQRDKTPSAYSVFVRCDNCGAIDKIKVKLASKNKYKCKKCGASISYRREEWERHHIIVKKGNITKEICDAIVNPANSHGIMKGGVGLAIKRAGGNKIEEEVMRKAPIAVGKAVITPAGSLPCRFVIHSPIMTNPNEKISQENVKLATQAAMRSAHNMGLRRVVFPVMGSGGGGLSPKEIIKAMVGELQKSSLEVVIVSLSDSTVNGIKEILEGDGSISSEETRCYETNPPLLWSSLPQKAVVGGNDYPHFLGDRAPHALQCGKTDSPSALLRF